MVNTREPEVSGNSPASFANRDGKQFADARTQDATSQDTQLLMLSVRIFQFTSRLSVSRNFRSAKRENHSDWVAVLKMDDLMKFVREFVTSTQEKEPAPERADSNTQNEGY